ncbi:hypothetical protein ACXJJ3_30415 [Kribbella sp. WER1]
MVNEHEHSVGLRELRHRTSEVLDRLAAEGRVRPAVRPGFRPRMRAGDGTDRLGDSLAALRDEERWCRSITSTPLPL